MFYKGQFIARIPNDENAQAKIEQYKAIHGQLRLWGRHPKRKQVMAQNGLKQNFMGDLPYRLGTEIVIYRNESGMTYQQFKALKVGDMIRTVTYPYLGKRSEVGIVLKKSGKNRIKISYRDTVRWTTRQCVILYQYDKR